MNSREHCDLLQNALATALPQLASFLDQSTSLHLALLSHEGVFLWANQPLAESVELNASDLPGRNITDFLPTGNTDLLRSYFAGQEERPDEAFIINMAVGCQTPRSLRCRLIPVEMGFLLLAEQTNDDNRHLQEELFDLYNQQAVLARENVRKTRTLAKMLDDLKKTQAMLVHQEKMASLGQMTAGIAHEINNPIAFVLNNEHILQRDLTDILEFISAVAEQFTELAANSPDIHATLMQKAVDLDLEYLMEAAPRKVTANIEGLERVKEIILDLRNFSRLDEAERKPCLLSSCVESSLRFLGPLLQEQGVSIETCFAQLPQVLCAPGPLNQAVSNILTNAIQASSSGQQVKVSTGENDTCYVIQVEDTGVGIPPEHLGKVFDPFFTTKPVGSGTGLGCSIAHQVVTAHRGQIEITSSIGVGTTVRILLPKMTK
jgi:two-component system, NtrC family, sensor kinase